MTKQVRETRKQARAWMVLNNIRNTDIQKALRMNNHVTVANTMAGRKHNRRVLQYLMDNGCPSEYLALPKDMGKAA